MIKSSPARVSSGGNCKKKYLPESQFVRDVREWHSSDSHIYILKMFSMEDYFQLLFPPT